MGNLVKPRYTPEQIDVALLALAGCGGNAAEAARQLAAADAEPVPGKDVAAIPERTIREWRAGVHAGRFVELSQKHGRRIEESIAVQAREVLLRIGEVEILALEKTKEKLESGDVSDPSTVLRNLATTKGINTDKLMTLTGRPNVITHERSAEDILKAINELAPDLFVVADEEGSAPSPLR